LGRNCSRCIRNVRRQSVDQRSCPLLRITCTLIIGRHHREASSAANARVPLHPTAGSRAGLSAAMPISRSRWSTDRSLRRLRTRKQHPHHGRRIAETFRGIVGRHLEVEGILKGAMSTQRTTQELRLEFARLAASSATIQERAAEILEQLGADRRLRRRLVGPARPRAAQARPVGHRGRC
jgi:hypothetical protein